MAEPNNTPYPPGTPISATPRSASPAPPLPTSLSPGNARSDDDSDAMPRPKTRPCGAPHRRSGQIQPGDLRDFQRRVRGDPPQRRRAPAARVHPRSERAPMEGDC